MCRGGGGGEALNTGSSLILVDCMSLDEHCHISPVNICWLRYLSGAHLNINLVICYHISTHSFQMYILCCMTRGSCRSFRCQ